MPEIQLSRRDPTERPVCVACRGELGSNDAALACTDCEVPLHWECWRGLKGCPTTGCAGKAKHSDRLTAQLAEWGPVAPQIREFEAPEDHPAPTPRPPKRPATPRSTHATPSSQRAAAARPQPGPNVLQDLVAFGLGAIAGFVFCALKMESGATEFPLIALVCAFLGGASFVGASHVLGSVVHQVDE